MQAGLLGRFGPDASRRAVPAVLLVAGLGIVVALVLAGRPRPVAAMGTLDQCLWGWPVIAFEGEDWKAAMPDDNRAYAPRQIPVAAWPSGMRYDEAAGELLDHQGVAVFRRGDRVHVRGAIVRTDGDPAPCFYTLGVKVETISAP